MCTGEHILWDAKNVCPNSILSLPNNVQTTRLNVKTKTYYCKQSRCLHANLPIVQYQ